MKKQGKEGNVQAHPKSPDQILPSYWKWKSLSCVRLFATHTVHGIFQARILERVPFPFSRGSSQPRDQTQVICVAGRFFTNWATMKSSFTVLRRNRSSWYFDLRLPGSKTEFLMFKPFCCLRVVFCYIFSDGAVVKNLPVNAGNIMRGGFDTWVGKIPCRRAWQPIPVFLPRKSHGQRSLVGYSLWVCRVGHIKWLMVSLVTAALKNQYTE